jgi:hypothetical protein
VEGDNQRSLNGRSEVRFCFLLAGELGDHVVDFSCGEGNDDYDCEVVGGIDHDEQFLREGFDLLLIIEKSNEWSKAVPCGPSHEEIRS